MPTKVYYVQTFSLLHNQLNNEVGRFSINPNAPIQKLNTRIQMYIIKVFQFNFFQFINEFTEFIKFYKSGDAQWRFGLKMLAITLGFIAY